MTPEALITLILVSVVVVLFVSERFRPDWVALVTLLLLSLLGLVPYQEVLQSFGNPAVITLMAIFILGQALTATGATQRLAEGLVRLLGYEEHRLRIGLTVLCALFSLVMNNIAAVALLMPVAMEVSRRRCIPPGRLLLPLAYAAALGGMATLFTTSNLIASGLLSAAGYRPFGVLDFLPIGGIVAVVGLLYLVGWGWRLLPPGTSVERPLMCALPEEELPRFYALQDRLREVVIEPDSPLVGKTLAESGIGSRWGLTVLGIVTENGLELSPRPDFKLEAGMKLIILGRDDRVAELHSVSLVEIPVHPDTRLLLSEQVGMLEVLIPPRSRAAGHTLQELAFREKYGLTVVALWREGRSYRTEVGERVLRFGDALLVYGPYERFRLLERDPDFLPLVQPEPRYQAKKALIAMGAFLLAILLAATGVLPVPLAMLLGVVLVTGLGAMPMNAAYAAVDWRTLFIIAGMLPVGTAIVRTGVADWVAQGVLQALAPLGTRTIAIGLIGLTALVAQLVSGGATVPTLLVPIAIALGRSTGLDPRLLAMSVAIVTGSSMMTPFSHPANLLVMSAGGYSARDYLRAGTPLVLLIVVITSILVLVRL